MNDTQPRQELGVFDREGKYPENALAVLRDSAARG